MSQSFVPTELLRWKYGGRFDFWLSHLDRVGNFIQTNKVRPIDREQLPGEEPMFMAAASEPVTDPRGLVPRKPFPGRLKVPHLHFKGDIYVLTDSQWREFSGATIKSMQEHLGRAQTVSYDSLMELSEAIGAIQ